MIGFSHKNINKEALFVALSIFVLIPCYIAWLFPTISTIMRLVSFVILLNHRRIMPSKDVFPIVVIAATFALQAFEIPNSPFGFVNIMGVFLLFITDFTFLRQIYEYFVRVFSIVIGLSVVVYIMVVILGINLPHFYLDSVSDQKTFDIYPFMTYVYNSADINSGRFTGLFDEPGVVGTICASILILNKFDYKNIFNIPIFIAGILSLSLAAMLMCAFYVIIFGNLQVKIGVSIIVIALFYYLSSLDIVQQYVFSRFDTDSGLFVNNRTSENFSYVFKQFLHSNDVFLGNGYGAAAEKDPSGASYKHLIYDFGIVFFVSYIIAYVRLAFLNIKDKKYILVALLLLFSILYQRPFLYNIAYSFILITAIAYNNNRETC